MPGKAVVPLTNNLVWKTLTHYSRILSCPSLGRREAGLLLRCWKATSYLNKFKTLSYGLNFVPWNSYIEFLTPVPPNITAFRDTLLKR